MSADLTVPPLPVVAWLKPGTRGGVGLHPAKQGWEQAYTGDGWSPLVRKSDADAAIAALTARAEAAERDANLWRKWAPYLSRVQRKPFGLTRTVEQWMADAAMGDAASQEKQG